VASTPSPVNERTATDKVDTAARSARVSSPDGEPTSGNNEDKRRQVTGINPMIWGEGNQHDAFGKRFNQDEQARDHGDDDRKDPSAWR
jgi:hypothetical protein